MNDKMELTPLDRLLYEIDPLGTTTTYTVTREQLEAIVKAYERDSKATYEAGWKDGYEEARAGAISALEMMD